MFSLVRCPPEKAIVYLDRPQRLGLMPTWAFWKRRDVWKIAGPMTGNFVFLWVMMLSLFVYGRVPLWLGMMLGSLGPFLFLAVLERAIRKRLRTRACAGSLPASDAEGDRGRPA